MFNERYNVFRKDGQDSDYKSRKEEVVKYCTPQLHWEDRCEGL